MEGEPSVEDMISEVQGSSEPTIEATPVQSEAPAPTAQEFEYNANGKTIKESLDVILKRASQGYNYAQHMEALKTQQQEIEAQKAEALGLQTKYGEIDKFAQENPEWNDHLQKTWEARFDISGKAQPEAVPGVPPEILKEFTEMKSFVDTVKAERADQAYNASVDRVKQLHPDVDFSSTDPETGKTLEQQVLDYASENSIGRFEPAFKAFYSDKLVENARMQAKDQLAGDIQKRSKAGILGTSQAPAQAKGDTEYPSNYKNMTSDQLHNWIVDKYAGQ